MINWFFLAKRSAPRLAENLREYTNLFSSKVMLLFASYRVKVYLPSPFLNRPRVTIDASTFCFLVVFMVLFILMIMREVVYKFYSTRIFINFGLYPCNHFSKCWVVRLLLKDLSSLLSVRIWS